MSAEILRLAASLMRKRAEKARAGRWGRRTETTLFLDEVLMHVVADRASGPAHVATCSGHRSEVNAEHIASWHPAVALAVADLLDAQAALCEEHGAFFDVEGMGDASALAVARAYLGESA